MQPSSYNDISHDKWDFWWKEDGHELAKAVFGAVGFLDLHQSYKNVANLRNLRLYSNRLASGLSGYDYAIQDEGDRIKLNVIKSVIDAATAQIASNRPRPEFLTTGGNYSQKQRAKKLNKFMAGQFYAMDLYSTAQKVFQDACIFGTGFLKIFEVNGEIRCERVFPNEILVDDVEARDGDPRSLYQHKEIDRQVLKDLYPKEADTIETAGLIRSDSASSLSQNLPNRVSVVEAWHLPSGPNAGDGKHVVCVDECVLFEEPWERDRFPFASFRWNHAPLGFWGIGLAEELTPIQIEINFIAQKLQNLMNLATTQIFMKKGEGSGTFDNQDFGVRFYKNTPPVALNFNPASPQFYEHLDRLEAKAYMISGVSQSAASSQVPMGLKSGEAIRRYNEVGNRRFQHVVQNWEQFFMNAAELIIDCARDIEERGDGDIRVLSQGSKEIEEIQFSEVSIPEDKYVMRVFPTSLLPDTPSGKIEKAGELAQVNPEFGRHIMSMLTDIPDIESVANRINAPYDLVDKRIEAIIDSGDYEPPLPYMDLAYARQQGQLALQQAEKDGVPEERLDLLRLFVDMADRLANPEPAPGAAAPPGAQAPVPPLAPPQGAPQPPAMPPMPGGMPMM